MAEDDEVNLIAQNVVADEEDEILTESPARKQPVASLGKQGQQQHSSSESSDDEERGDYAFPTRRSRRYGSRIARKGTSWWFQEPAVKRNWCVILVAWGFVFIGIACFITGIGLEIAYHSVSDDILRGFVFIIVAVIILLPSVYATTHVYLAAKRIGRVRFSSVWFFTK